MLRSDGGKILKSFASIITSLHCASIRAENLIYTIKTLWLLTSSRLESKLRSFRWHSSVLMGDSPHVKYVLCSQPRLQRLTSRHAGECYQKSSAFSTLIGSQYLIMICPETFHCWQKFSKPPHSVTWLHLESQPFPKQSPRWSLQSHPDSSLFSQPSGRRGPTEVRSCRSLTSPVKSFMT